MARILILGGDGYLGWPTAMRFSGSGNEVTAVDNYFRRKACETLGLDMLYPAPLLDRRADLWAGHTGREIRTAIGDLADPVFLRCLFAGGELYEKTFGRPFDGPPDAIVHYAEQPSAPYSMMNHQTALETLVNNLAVTNNLMFAVRDHCPGAHIIKLGTMGEYGTPNIDIEEGWIEIEHKGRKDAFLFPRQAGSIYHTSKIMDTDLLWFGVRTWNLRVTDLMQGPVYGVETEESRQDARLMTFFNYDEIFGTVLNRFVVQAVCGHPLTVYGSGGQKRGYLDIRDTLQCVEIAAENPPAPGELRIYNQIMEVFGVAELAEMVRETGADLGYEVKVQRIPNPRVEKEDHYYNPVHGRLVELGVKPHLLTRDALAEMFNLAGRRKDAIRRDIIMKGIAW